MDQAQQGTTTQAFQFTGAGGEYFRIWIVNLALTIVTLGIYSAWAKVRRLQYFYRNTSIAGSSFDFHGDPVAILKGRLIAVGLFILYNVAGNLSVALGIAALIALAAVLPWLIQRSLRFKLYNSSWRGLRFRFAGSIGEAYQAFLLWPFLAYVTLGILIPVAHREIKRYQHGNSRFGDAAFTFDAGVRPFYGIYLRMVGFVLLLIVAMGVVLGVSGFIQFAGAAADPEQKKRFVVAFFIIVAAFYLLLFVAIWPWFTARMQNLVWNHTALGPHRLRSAVRARDLFAIYLTNFIGIVVTLGLFKPWADIRLARYRLTHMALEASGDLDAFVSTQAGGVSATGEEAADLFDVDISF